MIRSHSFVADAWSLLMEMLRSRWVRHASRSIRRERERGESDQKRYEYTWQVFEFKTKWAHHDRGGDFANYLRGNSGVKGCRSQAARTGLPALPCGCVWFCLVGLVTQLARGGECAPSFRSRFTTRPPPPWLRRDEREDVPTAFRGFLQPFQFGSA